MRIAPAAAIALALTLTAAGGAGARDHAKPDFTAALKSLAVAASAEDKASKLARSGAGEAQVEAAVADARTALERAVAEVRAQPVTDSDYQAFRSLITHAENNDLDLATRKSGKGLYSSDAYECKYLARHLLERISETPASPTLDKAADSLTVALGAEESARQPDTTKASIADTISLVRNGEDVLRLGYGAMQDAATNNLLTSSELHALYRKVQDAALEDAAAVFALKRDRPDPATAREHIDKAIAYKNEALGIVEHAIAHPPAFKPGENPLSLSLSAVFAPADLATKYTAAASDKDAGRKLTYVWTLTLQQVDPTGSAPPGFQSTNPTAPNYASAAIDPTCNNARLAGGSIAFSTGTSDVYIWKTLGAEFEWYHGDHGSYPGSDYGCDHTKMGVRGHQGTVSVTVSDGIWSCTASIPGSNLSTTPVKSDPADCKRD